MLSARDANMQAFEGGQFGAVCRCGWMGNGLDLSAPPQDEFVRASSLNPGDWLFRVAKEIATFSQKA